MESCCGSEGEKSKGFLMLFSLVMFWVETKSDFVSCFVRRTHWYLTVSWCRSFTSLKFPLVLLCLLFYCTSQGSYISHEASVWYSLMMEWSKNNLRLHLYALPFETVILTLGFSSFLVRETHPTYIVHVLYASIPFSSWISLHLIFCWGSF